MSPLTRTSLRPAYAVLFSSTNSCDAKDKEAAPRYQRTVLYSFIRTRAIACQGCNIALNSACVQLQGESVPGVLIALVPLVVAVPVPKPMPARMHEPQAPLLPCRARPLFLPHPQCLPHALAVAHVGPARHTQRGEGRGGSMRHARAMHTEPMRHLKHPSIHPCRAARKQNVQRDA